MFLQIDDFLNETEVRQINELARQAKFIEGRRSNPHNLTKTNVIVDPADPQGQHAAQVALGAFQRNEQARNFAFPQRLAIPQLARYSAGQAYGVHTDAAFLPAGQQPLRSDISCTIFISDPSTYQGGDLVIYLGAEELHIKGNPGSTVLYPSTTLHQVTPITAGERLVILTFIESQIADERKRSLLHVLNEVRAAEGLKMDWSNRTRLEYVSMNLQRMWAK